MPAPIQAFITAPPVTQFQVSLEPAQNMLHSLMLLTKAEELSGLGEWIYRTDEALSAEQRQRNRLVLVGFHYALSPERSYPSFTAYIDHLAAMDPVKLRDKMMDAYSNMECYHLETGLSGLSQGAALENVDNYLSFLSERFPAEHVDQKLESLAYTYVIDPPKMQALIVAHLRTMWDGYLKAEWKRVQPMVQAAVGAFQQIDYSQMDKLEAARLIVGQSLDKKHWPDEIDRAEQLLFVPNPHVGPYVGMFMRAGVLGILFGARLPSGVQIDTPDLSINEILVRLGALADDTRLRILKLVAENGEQRSQDIMDRLELSQSASSRHLKQLSATGYLKERRCAGAKCYSLNPERVQDTLQAIENFLLIP
jgi:DNA-binding transcriptional ArsR family regulator